MKVALVVLFMVLICRQFEAHQSAQKYCGRRFPRVVAALCYPSTELVKRDGSWWMLQERARALGRVRGKRGPVEECCKKPCTIEEVRTYCEMF
ncbi:unnamed protein product [Arctia plantaginis]|uniref:Insulin-like domain-containing protein n=1 Tax=Arctia plantaginis TaxID=874455 RepID=A0A8S0ZFC6_ARCPL|nr:unnamed protein product [Arctia plantaginis]